MSEGTRAAERWLPVIGFEGYYEVSDHGRVRSLDRVIIDCRGRRRRLRSWVLSPRSDEDGRLRVELSVDGVHYTQLVHHLVLTAFVGPRPPGLVGCHWDGNNQHNHLSNLRWDTHLANSDDQRRHGTHHNTVKDVCPYDHLLVHPNLTAHSIRNGHRVCLACNRAHGSYSYYRSKGRPFDFRVEADRRYRRIMGVA